MCGIVGYIGKKEASPILISGLRRLEYRGYDSAGLTVWNGRDLVSVKRIGKISDFAQELTEKKLVGSMGIAHTRWATHGIPSEENAHPQFDCSGDIAVVHNGIIENFASLKKALIQDGHKFTSQTDTEVVAHLIEKYNKEQNFEEAVFSALRNLEGAYGLVVISAKEPGKIIVAKKGSPLVIGVGVDEYFVASDTSAILDHTKNVIYLDDGEVGVIEETGYKIFNLADNKISNKLIEEVSANLEMIEKGGFDTFMLKEIFEQSESILNAMRGHILHAGSMVKFGGLEGHERRLSHIKRIIIVACGTSFNSGLVGEFMIEELAKIPVEVEYASEFRYRNPIVDDTCLVIAISQSGETADTLAALKLAKERGAFVYGICNVVGSSISRAVDAGAYLHAGPEISVASTKAFTSQITVLSLLALYFAKERKVLSKNEMHHVLSHLEQIPNLVKIVLENNKEVEKIAKEFYQAKNFMYSGRGINFPIALEGALKLKELSYIHAEGCPAAEMKHGPIALIDKEMPVVFIATKDSTYDKIVSNIMEVKARGGRVIAIATIGDDYLKTIVEHVLYVPETLEIFSPILNVIPLQLLAYYITTMKGLDVDKPRNLAKSVTVE